MRDLEVSQFISILKWKENEIFQHFSIKQGSGDSGEREATLKAEVIQECI